jgi:hypothetical protein
MISVLSTFVVIGLVAVGVKATRWFIAYWKARPDNWWKIWRYYQPGWWRGWKLELRKIPQSEPGETAPLLA